MGYHCLPCPPFHPDPKQLEAIEVLKKVFDDVIVAHAKPLPPKQLPPQVKAAKEEGSSLGMFSSLFGGASKKKDAPKKPPKPVDFVPTPVAPKGAYMYGGCGSGKTVLLDLFFRSLPDSVTARRLHWHEFIRDAFRAMQGQPAGDNIFVAMAD